MMTDQQKAAKAMSMAGYSHATYQAIARSNEESIARLAEAYEPFDDVVVRAVVAEYHETNKATVD